MPMTAHSIINGICSSSVDVSLNENGSGHDIIWFGRPLLLWGSQWQSAESWETNQNKFRNIILFAKFKLLGGTNQWNQDVKMKRKAVLAVRYQGETNKLANEKSFWMRSGVTH